MAQFLEPPQEFAPEFVIVLRRYAKARKMGIQGHCVSGESLHIELRFLPTGEWEDALFNIFLNTSGELLKLSATHWFFFVHIAHLLILALMSAGMAMTEFIMVVRISGNLLMM